MTDSPRTIGPWIRDKAERNRDQVALEVMDREKTYAEISRDAGRVAAGLNALGLGAGDRASIQMKNTVEFVDSWFGMCQAGIVEVPINTAYRGDLLQYQLADSGSRAIVIDEEYVDRIEPVIAGATDLEHVVINREHGIDRGDPDLPDRVALHDLADLYLDRPPPEPDLKRTDTSAILYTSGTTGPSKGVVLCHEANLVLAEYTARLVGYDSSDVLYTAFPLFHINAKYTSVLCAMAVDARVVMDQRFSASRFWDMCREKGVTAFNYMGALLMMLWKQPEGSDDADNPVRYGFGAPTPVEIWETFEARFGVELTEIYGMTEVANTCANPPRRDRKVGTAGRESELYEVRIVDDDDMPLPPDTPGEIVVRPKRPSIMFDRYHEMPDATAESFRNLWFHTGDRGRMDADGFLTFIDRNKDCVRRRGENISSWEVESVINTHEAVLEAAVYGVPSEIGEEEVMTAIVRQPGATLGEAELLDFCVPRMAHFAVPRFVRWMDELPKTPSQRVQKFKLREEGVTVDTWDRDRTDYVVPR